MKHISRDSKLPLYYQLYEILRDRITHGAWQPGDMLPPESEMVQEYQVSRITVRQALEELVKDGLIIRQPGRGTFVAHPAVEEGLVRIVNFTQDMRLRGLKPSSKVLLSELMPAPQEIADKLDVEPGEELVRLDRLRLADGEPMSIEESHLIHRHCPGILDGDYASNSLREALERRHGIRWSRAKQVIRAILAPRRLARPLSIPEESPLLYIERISYSQQDIPIEFLRIYYRADRYALYNELQG